MSEAEFMGMMVLAVAAFAGLMATLIKPIIQVNKNLTELNTTLKSVLDKDAVRDTRLNEHGRKLDEHEAKLVEHETRLRHIEK